MLGIALGTTCTPSKLRLGAWPCLFCPWAGLWGRGDRKGDLTGNRSPRSCWLQLKVACALGLISQALSENPIKLFHVGLPARSSPISPSPDGQSDNCVHLFQLVDKLNIFKVLVNYVF